MMDLQTGQPTHKVNDKGIPQQNRESQKDPGEVRCTKVENTKDVHSYEVISSAPHINQHHCQCMS